MLIPRRVRRRLLLPPGWVALGFLLLLGCQVVRPWQGQFKVWNMLPIAMFPLHSDKSATRNSSYLSPMQLNKFRSWHNISFNGEPLNDLRSAAATEAAIKQINADSIHDVGVRVTFNSGSTYANLVRVLDIMNYTGQEKYGLDIRRQPATLYAITSKPAARELLHRYCFVISPSVFTKQTLAQKLAEFNQHLSNSWKQGWRVPFLLLASISFLCLRRLMKFCQIDFSNNL